MKIIDMDELDDLEDVNQEQTEVLTEQQEEEDIVDSTQVSYEDTDRNEPVAIDTKEHNEQEDLLRKKEQEQAQKNRKKNREENPVREVVGLILSVAVVVLLTFVIVKYVGQRTEVSGISMEYTLSDKDNLIVDKITYRFSDPKRFDIIVFPYEGVIKDESNPTYYIKRIIGLPGETVQIKDGIIYINGKELKESYGKEVIEDPKKAENEIKLGKDEYFVLGDNRNHSADSREIGNIKRSQIIGRAWVRIWPMEKFGVLKHQ